MLKPKLVVIVIVLLSAHLVQLSCPATVTFTGNAIADFAGVDTFTLVDGKDIALDCGFDIRSIRFHYDQASDTAYFGELSKGRQWHSWDVGPPLTERPGVFFCSFFFRLDIPSHWGRIFM